MDPNDLLKGAPVATFLLEKGTEIGKNWQERKTAKSQQILNENINRQINQHAPQLVESLQKSIDSTIIRNQTQTLAVMQMSTIAGDTGARVECTMETMAETANLMAENTNLMAGDTAHMAKSIEFLADRVDDMAMNSAGVTKEINGVRIIGNSMLDRMDYHMKFQQMAIMALILEVKKIGENLKGINNELRNSNSLTVQGSHGEHGWAQYVYNFIEQRIEETAEASGKESARKLHEQHRFFVYHPDTDWYPSFRKLITRSPLPPYFVAKSDNLDQLCISMMLVREALIEDYGDAGKGIVFHLLIPAWYPFEILEPLHFPDELQPLQVEGLKHKGKPFVRFNLPAAPRELLNGIENVRDPRGLDTLSEIGMGATWLIGGSALNAGCLALGTTAAAATGLGALVLIPVWFGGFFASAETIAKPITMAVGEALQEDPPRILGTEFRRS
jgi:hypothetical protein